MAQKEKILFILTGGTIDSFYDGSKDTVVPRPHSIVPQYIRSLKMPIDTEFKEVCMKDSRDLTQKDLAKILRTVKKSHYKKIVITHGTYTAPDTARIINANFKGLDKTVVITCSMMPLDGFTGSDAPFNLGFAVAKVLELPRGVYICMNGTAFNPNEVAKLLSGGKFYSIFGEK